VGKLVVLKLGEGSFDLGFPVTLQIGEEGKLPNAEITGRLPPTPKIPQYYNIWASSYRRLGSRYRLEASSAQITNVSKIENCYKSAQILRDGLNLWLTSEPFRPLREKLLEKLLPTDEIRLIIQTENNCLRRLPWHLWDFCERYPHVEIALSGQDYELIEQVEKIEPVEPVEPVELPQTKVRILAILGNSQGINTQADRLILEQLPDAEVTFLVEPQRHELTENIWKQCWDILFFAGHSSSANHGEKGLFSINQNDNLTIDQLKLSLKKAVERGLKIAIFNSCDGLGLAKDLDDLQIPQIIVMREPVPDLVSQEFLKYFLETFAQGKSFYLAVREARERLQGWEDRFPCATWLPMICQNLAVLPPTWQDLGGRVSKSNFPTPPQIPLQKPETTTGSIVTRFLLSVVVTSLLMMFRQVGILQPLELKAFDQLMKARPPEAPDSRLLVVAITEEDIKAQKNELRPGTSLSDRSLVRLLQKLESYQASSIGLDVYRDFPVSAEYPELAKHLQNSNRLISVCKVSTNINDPGIAPPPEVPRANLGFSDVATDPDKVLRRHLLALTPSPASACTASYALSSRLAFSYLQAKGISPKFTTDGYLQLGNTVFKRLETRNGGYQNIDAWGHQVLLNYRYHNSPQDFVAQVTLSQVLKNQINPEYVKNRIVLIGVTAESRNDYFLTPYSNGHSFYQKMPGVIAHAQMVSQILSSVLDGRKLLWVWPLWGEVLWIWGWSLVGTMLAWRFGLLLRLGLLAIALSILSALCFALLLQGGWVPLVPSALVLVFSNFSVFAYGACSTKQQQRTLSRPASLSKFGH
jgi:CHASE2 domain-containing sensor protein